MVLNLVGILVKKLLILKILWVFEICDYIKFQVGGRENQNICVFAYHVNRKAYVLFPYMLFAICAKTCHVN